jgi:hypothetical protein
MNDTPVTDAFFYKKGCWSSDILAFCQRLERERDEARDIIRKAIMKFSEDDSDGRIAAAMLAILSKKEPVS